ncbi:MAG: TIGR00730 family Rossman fold protein [Chitinophagaceae bacterium]|nr:TIGR00730 family Rossman fold protein [Chitinophagaceae bacterium]MCW5904652.1 TIGR00730 family Rossman fold protein [Chitinophagaceae bacterium]
MTEKWESVAVFCGSKAGNNPLFIQHAKELGILLAQHNITMVYGGGKVGIMGAIADTMMENNGSVVGIIPELLIEWEQQHLGITKLHVVKDMHIRKKMMYELSDAAIVLPGGYGTMDELFEVTTWNNLKIHEKKIIILNTAGFYNHLIAHINTMLEQGFLYDNWQQRIVVVENPQAIFSS